MAFPLMSSKLSMEERVKDPPLHFGFDTAMQALDGASRARLVGPPGSHNPPSGQIRYREEKLAELGVGWWIVPSLSLPAAEQTQCTGWSLASVWPPGKKDNSWGSRYFRPALPS